MMAMFDASPGASNAGRVYPDELVQHQEARPALHVLGRAQRAGQIGQDGLLPDHHEPGTANIPKSAACMQ